MTWGWRRECATCWRLDDIWSVQQDWSTGKWYVVAGEVWRSGWDDVGPAMEAAEAIRAEARRAEKRREG
jgi:hypothetical protein